MRIFEPHALTSETVEVGGGDLGVLVVASKVAVTQIIGQDEDEVGLLHGVKQGERGKERKQADREAFHDFRVKILGRSIMKTG
jgi:hypothetical protein